MNKLLSVLIKIAFVLFVFLFGYSIGATPSTEQLKEDFYKDTYTQDMKIVSDNFGRLYNLCEQKYQAGISGDMVTAYEIKGKMDQLESQIGQTLFKYPESKNKL